MSGIEIIAFGIGILLGVLFPPRVVRMFIADIKDIRKKDTGIPLWRRIRFSRIGWAIKKQPDMTPTERAHEKHLKRKIHDCNCWMCEAGVTWETK